jgi:hypothetical protein
MDIILLTLREDCMLVWWWRWGTTFLLSPSCCRRNVPPEMFSLFSVGQRIQCKIRASKDFVPLLIQI